MSHLYSSDLSSFAAPTHSCSFYIRRDLGVLKGKQNQKLFQRILFLHGATVWKVPKDMQHSKWCDFLPPRDWFSDSNTHLGWGQSSNQLRLKARNYSNLGSKQRTSLFWRLLEALSFFADSQLSGLLFQNSLGRSSIQGRHVLSNLSFPSGS